MPVAAGRVIRNRDTLSLDEMYVSRAVYEEIIDYAHVNVDALPAEQGALRAF